MVWEGPGGEEEEKGKRAGSAGQERDALPSLGAAAMTRLPTGVAMPSFGSSSFLPSAAVLKLHAQRTFKIARDTMVARRRGDSEQGREGCDAR